MARIGLLGGSFNPAHRGHRRVSLAALAALGLDEVWWLVSPGNPLKPAAGMAAFAARLGSARAMARAAPIRALDFETRAGTRYTVDTLAAVRARYPQHDFIWLMGADTLPRFHEWKQWRRMARATPIAVLSRPGYEGPARAARAMGWLRRFVQPPATMTRWTKAELPAIWFLSLPPDRTSATAIRAADPDWALRFAAPPAPMENDPARSRHGARARRR